MTIGNIICWSASLDALHWITGAHKKWKCFIQNKVEKIRKLTNVNIWRHCPGNLNPTDLPSQGTTATDFYNLFSEWNNGPTFLHQSVNTCPMSNSVTDFSTSEDNKVVNVVGSISSKDMKTLIFVNRVQLITYFVLQHLYCVLFQI